MLIVTLTLDRYTDGGEVTPEEKAVIERFHRISEHMRVNRKDYPGKQKMHPPPFSVL